MYKLTGGGVLHPEGFFVPTDVTNRHWQEYLSWVALGNTPLPADGPPPIHPGELAKSGARQWFVDNPTTLQIFTMSVSALETEVNSLVDALFPTATAQNRTRTKKLWMAYAVSIRFLVKREINGQFEV